MIEVDFSKIELPKIYKRNGYDHFLDPFRHKLIKVQPEEIVRQRVAKYLVDELEIPHEMIGLENPMSYFKKRANGRADIIVYGKNVDEEYKPVLIVECKEPNVAINDRTFRQVYRYDEMAKAGIIAVTNGDGIYFQALNENSEYINLTEIPKYNNLIEKKGLTYDDSEFTLWDRPDYSNNYSKEIIDAFIEDQNIGDDTDPKLHSFIINLAGFFEDSSWELEPQEINGIKIIEDLGLQYLSFSNGGGGFTNHYRCIMVEDENENNQVLCLRVHGLEHLPPDHSTCPNQKGNTHIVVAIDDEDGDRWSLQVCLDKLCKKQGDEYSVWHDFRTSVVGGCKNSEVKEYIELTAPELIDNKSGKVLLGILDGSKHICWDQPSTKEFMSRLLKYAVVREDFKRTKRRARQGNI